MAYKSARALEMAVKEAAKASPLDTGRAVSSFYFHRFLCRVFAEGNDSFILKGGQSMLARTIDARATCDIDLLSTRISVDEALNNLIELAQVDLDDYITFEFIDAHPIRLNDDYRDGLSVKFMVYAGAKRIQDIAIDLVVDEFPLEDAELVSPVDRIEVADIQVCDYLVYPVENALSDKLCALHERHDGRPSSRVKDLVDIAVYVTTCDIDGSKFHKCINRELGFRGISCVQSFSIPSEWGVAHSKQYSKLCLQTRLPERLRTIASAEKLVKSCVDDVIAGRADDKKWTCESLRRIDKPQVM